MPPEFMRPRAPESIASIRTVSSHADARASWLVFLCCWELADSRSSYTDNGGSTLAIAGADFTVMAGDTRLTSGYSINSRHHPKLFKIGGTTADQKDATIVLSVVGFAADGEALKERLDAICKMYRYRHGKPMSVKACAQRLSTILYQKRFFPY